MFQPLLVTDTRGRRRVQLFLALQLPNFVYLLKLPGRRRCSARLHKEQFAAELPAVTSQQGILPVGWREYECKQTITMATCCGDAEAIAAIFVRGEGRTGSLNGKGKVCGHVLGWLEEGKGVSSTHCCLG